MEVPKIFRKNERELDHVSTSDVSDIDFDKMTAQSKDVNQKWLDEQRKENEKQAEKNKPREEARLRVSQLRKEAGIEKLKAFKRQGQFNFIRDSRAKLLIEEQEHEKWFSEHGWKRIPESQEKENGPYKKYAEWKKEFECFEKTPYELEEWALRMKAQGYKQNAEGDWYMPVERQRLNEIITQESRKY